MARNMPLPKIGVNMTEAVISRWLVQVGDKVKEGDPVLEAETDKSTQEVYADGSGTVARLLAAEGDTVRCYEDILVLVEEGGMTTGNNRVAAAGMPAPKAATPAPAQTRRPQPEEKPVVPPVKCTSRPRISPLARKLAGEKGIDITRLSPAAPGLRIVKADVLRYLEAAAAPAPAAVVPPVPPLPPAPEVMEEIPLSPTRRAIAGRLSASNAEKPAAALTLSADASSLLDLRERYRNRGTDLKIDAILAKVVGRALSVHRSLNAVLEGRSIRVLKDIHVGVAVDTPKGLLVPVLRHADSTPLAHLNERLLHMAHEARESRISAMDLDGGTFTVTNLGAYGIEQFTPIINPPECGILAVGAIQKQLVPDGDGNPAVQKRVSLTLVFDHRMVDGAPAARFLRECKELMENPDLLI